MFIRQQLCPHLFDLSLDINFAFTEACRIHGIAAARCFAMGA